MKLFQNCAFNFFHRVEEMSEISLAWSIMGGSKSLCEGVRINFWKHRAKQINVTTGNGPDAQLWGWGSAGLYSRLGQPTLATRGTPVRVLLTHCLFGVTEKWMQVLTIC